jgi:hypothetical protein
VLLLSQQVVVEARQKLAVTALALKVAKVETEQHLPFLVCQRFMQAAAVQAQLYKVRLEV